MCPSPLVAGVASAALVLVLLPRLQAHADRLRAVLDRRLQRSSVRGAA
ncbi:hypothetical protein ACFYR1_21845 [Streptomyces canus]